MNNQELENWGEELAQFDKIHGGEKMKNTPGPWNLDIRVGCIAIYSGPKENCLSHMHNSPRTMFYKSGEWDKEKKCWNTDPQDEANARLIAAAPDYHEHAYNLAMLVLQSDFYKNPGIKDAVDNVLAVYSKADGI